MTTEPIHTLQTFRMPRGMWKDLEETVIHQDRQFLTLVARDLGLPVADVLRRCLGTGAPQTVPVLWMPRDGGSGDAPDVCPWWECHGDGLWRRCPRLRLSPTMPCQIHERSTPCPRTRLHTDPIIKALPLYMPIRHGDALYWYDPTDPDAPLYNEDGTLELSGHIRTIQFRGEAITVWARS